MNFNKQLLIFDHNKSEFLFQDQVFFKNPIHDNFSKIKLNCMNLPDIQWYKTHLNSFLNRDFENEAEQF